MASNLPAVRSGSVLQGEDREGRAEGIGAHRLLIDVAEDAEHVSGLAPPGPGRWTRRTALPRSCRSDHGRRVRGCPALPALAAPPSSPGRHRPGEDRVEIVPSAPLGSQARGDEDDGVGGPNRPRPARVRRGRRHRPSISSSRAPAMTASVSGAPSRSGCVARWEVVILLEISRGQGSIVGACSSSCAVGSSRVVAGVVQRTRRRGRSRS